METYLHPTQMRLTTDLFYARQNKLHSIVGSLTLNEVKTEAALKATITRIKREILLIPVEVKEPKITDHKERRRQLTPAMVLQNASPVLQEIVVEFPFTGSGELFAFVPKAGCSGMRFYQPSGDSVIIEVTIGALDKNMALEEARRKFSDTAALVRQVSVEAQAWSAQIEGQIPGLVDAQRKKLLEFYS